MASLLLAGSGLPSVPPLRLDVATRSRFDELANLLQPGNGEVLVVESPGQVSDFLRYLGTQHSLLFHGTKRAGLANLAVERESGDSREFGRQQAVFASNDPLWAMFFALVNRPFAKSFRNASMASIGNPAKRRYYLSADVPDTEPLLTRGWVYVVSANGFRSEPATYGAIETGQWVSTEPVRPLAAVAVAPQDYPLAAAVRRHRPQERQITTLWQSRRQWSASAALSRPSGRQRR